MAQSPAYTVQGSQGPPPILRLCPELQGMIADRTDIISTLSWRSTCRTTYDHVTRSLRCSLLRILSPFFTRPGTFLTTLTHHRGVIGGISALAFVMRDPSLECSFLQLYIPRGTYAAFVDSLVHSPTIAGTITRIQCGNITEAFSREREICCLTTIVLDNRRSIIIYCSSTPSAISGIVTATSSALVNFVSEHCVGCGYPTLTSLKRAILCDARLRSMSRADQVVMDVLLRAGFHFAVSPSTWIDYTDIGGGNDLDEQTLPCTRFENTCPMQGRYFGDKGSVLALLDPLGSDLSFARTIGAPPFGVTAVWRLGVSFDCADGCDIDDRVLQEWMDSCPMVITPCPLPLPPFRSVDMRSHLYAPARHTFPPTLRRAKSI